MCENKDMKPTAIYQRLCVGNTDTGMNRHYSALTGNDFAATLMSLTRFTPIICILMCAGNLINHTLGIFARKYTAGIKRVLIRRSQIHFSQEKN